MAVSTETSTRTTWVHFLLSLMAPCTIPLNPYAGCLRPHMRLPRVTVTRELSYRKEEDEDHSGSPPSGDVDLGKDDTERVPSEPSVTGWSEVVIIGTMPSLLKSRRRGEDTNHKRAQSVTYTSNMKRPPIVCRHRTALRAHATEQKAVSVTAEGESLGPYKAGNDNMQDGPPGWRQCGTPPVPPSLFVTHS
jgi:hypothetical protein